MPRRTGTRFRSGTATTAKNGAPNAKLKQSAISDFLHPKTPPNSPTKASPKTATDEEGDEIVVVLEEKIVPVPASPPRSVSPKKFVRTPVKRKEEDEIVVIENGKHEPKSPKILTAPRKSHTITTPEFIAKPKTPKVGVLRDFAVVRKSGRQAEKQKKEADIAQLYEKILHGIEDPGIQVIEFPGKGRGLVAIREFQLNEYVVEYAGDLVSVTEAKEREVLYASQPDEYGCYMYYFKHKDKTLCVDATAETGRYGRLLNHSRIKANLRTEVIEINQKPYLILRANRKIRVGEELQYDYGDRDPVTLAAFPWLKD